MRQEGNKYLFELYGNNVKPVKDTVEGKNLKEVINIIDNNYDLENEEFDDLHLELLGR
jgi:hypothetical protein